MKLHELVGKLERAATKLETFDDRLDLLEGRTARVERTVWIGVGIVLALQLVLSNNPSFSNGRGNVDVSPAAAATK